MAWVGTAAAGCVLHANASRVMYKARAMGKRTRRMPVQSGHGAREEIELDGKDCDMSMYKSAPTAAVIEKFRQWAVDVGLIGEGDTLKHLIIDIDADEDRAHFWVERAGDMRQLAFKAPMVELD